MTKDLPGQTEYLSVSEAAKELGVSIDTVRRWDKAGKLTAHRLDGKNRSFSRTEINHLKLNKPVEISQAAKQLNVSVSTLRRLERRGVISPSKDISGTRLFNPEELSEIKKALNKKRPKQSVTPAAPPPLL